MNFEHDYIIPGDCFPDETVLCMSCGNAISRLGYKEMPMIGDSKKTVKVAAKMPMGNYSQTPVIMYRKGKESIVHVLTCKECRNFDLNEESGQKIIRQLVRAMQIESRWAGYPEEAAIAVSRAYADARMVRRITAEELVDLYAKQGVH